MRYKRFARSYWLSFRRRAIKVVLPIPIVRYDSHPTRFSVCSFAIGSELAWSAAGNYFLALSCWWLPFASFPLPIVHCGVSTVLAEVSQRILCLGDPSVSYLC